MVNNDNNNNKDDYDEDDAIYDFTMCTKYIIIRVQINNNYCYNLRNDKQ